MKKMLLMAIAATAAIWIYAIPQPGLVQGKLANMSDTTTPFASWTSTSVVPGVMFATCAGNPTCTYTYGGTTYSMGANAGWGYHGYMRMVGGLTYYFAKNFDDAAYIKVDGVSVLANTVWNQYPVGAYTPSATGWHEVDIRLGNGTGGVGGGASWISAVGSGIIWNTNGISTAASTLANPSLWHPLHNIGSDVYLYAEIPARDVEATYSVNASGAWIATLELGANPTESASDILLYAADTDYGADESAWTAAAVTPTTLGSASAEAQTYVTSAFAGTGSTERYYRVAVRDVANGYCILCAAVEVNDEPSSSISLTDTGVAYARFDGSLANAGRGKTSADIYFAYGVSEPTDADFSLVKADWAVGEDWFHVLTGLSAGTAYHYAFIVSNDTYGTAVSSGVLTNAVSGTPGAGGTRLDFGNAEYAHMFTNAAGGVFEFTAPGVPVSATVLAVGGGGSGGCRGGGGGAGGMVLASNVTLAGGPYTVSVGRGGAENANRWGRNNGQASYIATAAGTDVVRAVGGGGGGSSDNPDGAAGGSGGAGGVKVVYGANRAGLGGSPTAGQGNAGGAGNTDRGSGGGGGAGAIGKTNATGGGAAGGAGLPCDITGVEVWYGGGGGGGCEPSWVSGGAGGKGGGGAGGPGYGDPGRPGADHTGGGGGGGGGNSNFSYKNGGKGGSGIVVIRYVLAGGGTMPAGPMLLFNDATAGSDATATLEWTASWAGENATLCDIYAAWGLDPGKLFFTNLLQAATMGTGSATLANVLPGRTYYVELFCTNNLGVFTNTIARTFTVPADGAEPDAPDARQPVIATAACTDFTGGDVASFAGTLSQAGTGSGFGDCIVRIRYGTPPNIGSMALGGATSTPSESGAFALDLEDIVPGTTYYAVIEVENAAGFLDRWTPIVFTLLQGSTLATPAANQSQLTVTFSDTVNYIGANTTTVWLRWSFDGATWNEETLGTCQYGDTGAFSKEIIFGADDWNKTVSYAFVCSNSCDSASWGDIKSSTVAIRDAAVYTWKTGVAEGFWNDLSSWNDGGTTPCVGYPTLGAIAQFAAGQTSVVYVARAELCKYFTVNYNNLDLSFVGTASGAAITPSGLRDTGSVAFGQNATYTLDGVRVKLFSNTAKCSAGTHVVLRNGAYLELTAGNPCNLYADAYANVRFDIEGGSTLYSGSVYCGTGAMFVLSNGTMRVSSGQNFPLANVAGAPVEFVFRGASPLLDAPNGCYAEKATAIFTFEIPEDGYTTVPIKGNNSTAMLHTGNKVYFHVPKASAPIHGAGRRMDVQLVTWQKGVTFSRVAFGEKDTPDSAFYFTDASLNPYVFCTDNSGALATRDAPGIALAAPPTVTGVWYHHAPESGTVLVVR